MEALGVKCDYCNDEAVLRFRLQRLVRFRGRWIKSWSGQWLAGCSKHWQKASEAASAGIRR